MSFPHFPGVVYLSIHYLYIDRPHIAMCYLTFKYVGEFSRGFKLHYHGDYNIIDDVHKVGHDSTKQKP